MADILRNAAVSERRSLGRRARRRIRRLLLSGLAPRLLSRPSLQWLASALFRLALAGMNIETWDGRQRDERLFLRRARARAATPPVVFDVGANVGQYLALLRDEWPDARVFSFEPNPRCYAALRDAAEASGTVAENIGLGAIAGTLVLYDKARDRASQHATLVTGVMEEIYAAETETIPVAVDTVDSYAAARGVRRIDLLKIDVEGFELEVLRGARELIRDKRIGMLQIEFNTMNVLSRVFVRDLSKELPGYRMFRILGNGELYDLTEVPIYRREIFGYQNLVAIAEPGGPPR